MSFNRYHQAVNYLEKLARDPLQYDYMRLHASSPAIFLERAKYFLKLLGNPDRGFKYVHITGTSGKGSTVAFLHEILHQSGLRVGSFTSPFACTSIEKIKVNDKLIKPNELARLIEKIKPAIAKMKQSRFGRSSYFECFFAIALLYFKQLRCQWVILEVGMGGAFDATNAIARSEVSAITNIGLDHTHILGKTRTKIAREKMGIIKTNSHFFTTETRSNLLKIFQRRCGQLKTKFHLINVPKDADIRVFETQMAGRHQQLNAALAMAIAKQLKISSNVIKNAIGKVSLPCRFEIMQKNPLVILDGAHNPDKIKSVIHNLKNLTYDKLYIMFACGRTKDARAMLKSLARAAEQIILTKFSHHVYYHAKAFKPEQISRHIGKFRNKKIESNPKKALSEILKKLKKNDALLITGSFYLAGELRKHWIPENQILKKRNTN